VVTDPPTHKHTHTQTGPITIHCSTASTQCNKAARTDLCYFWHHTISWHSKLIKPRIIHLTLVVLLHYPRIH